MATPISKVVLTIDNKDYVYGLKQAESATKDFANEAERSFSRADKASNKLNLASNSLVTGFGNLRSAILGIGLGAFAVSALQTADYIADLSDATGISIGKLLEMKGAMVAAGGDASNLGKAVNTFYNSIEEANAGSDKLQEAFGKLGVSMKDLRTASEEDLLDKTFRGLANVKDATERTAMAQEIFGKSMMGVNLTATGVTASLEELRGKYNNQETATKQAADAVQRFEELVVSLKGAVVLAIEPILKWFNVMSEGEVNVQSLAGVIQKLIVAVAAFKIGGAIMASIQGVFKFIEAIVMLRKASIGAVAAQTALAAASAGAFAGPAGMVVGALAGVAAAAYAYNELNDLLDKQSSFTGPGQNAPLGPDATMEQQLAEEKRIAEGKNRDQAERNRQQQIGKELQSQLNAVNSLTEGYTRAARSNMERYQAEVDLLGKTQEEIDMAKGKADIEKRYADQIASLEDKRKGAKAGTLTLINESIAKIQELRDRELEVYEATKLQTQEYARQQDLIKRSAELGRTLAGIQDQVQAAQFQGTQATQSPFQRQFRQIQEDARVAAQNATRTFIQSFGDDPTKLNSGQLELMKTGVAAIEESYRQLAEQQTKNLEYSRTWEAGWNEAFNAYVDNATNAAQRAKDQFNAITSNMNSAIDKFVETGKFSFKDFTNSVLKDLVKIEMKTAAMNILRAASSGVNSLFAGFFAEGGTIPAGQFGIVGERGAEFVTGPATVIPMNKMAASGGSITQVSYNINAVDAMSFKQMIARDPAFLYAVTQQGAKTVPATKR